MLLILSCYFVLATALSAIAFLPPVRARLYAMLHAGRTYLADARTRCRWHAMDVLRGTRKRVVGSLRTTVTCGERHRRLIVGALIAVLLPPAIAMAFQQVRHFDYGDVLRGPDATTTAVLMGEHLSAPPPLLPQAFTTREVELVRPRLDLPHASREWALLDAEFQQRLLRVYKIMRERYGYEMTLVEGYRTPERQARLLALGANVTGVGPYQSYHQYGLAADSAFVRDNKLVITETDPWAMRGYVLYGATAESVGLVWGGRWKLKDYGHVELHAPVPARQRKAAAPPSIPTAVRP